MSLVNMAATLNIPQDVIIQCRCRRHVRADMMYEISQVLDGVDFLCSTCVNSLLREQIVSNEDIAQAYNADRDELTAARDRDRTRGRPPVNSAMRRVFKNKIPSVTDRLSQLRNSRSQS